MLPIGVGVLIGSVINLRLTAHYPQLMITWRGHPPPEERLYSGMVASVCFVIGIFWLGWTGNYPGVHWIVPELGSVVFGTSVCLIYMSFAVRHFFFVFVFVF